MASIELETTAGMGVRRSKVNEIITVLNAISAKLDAGGVTLAAWATGSESGGSISNVNFGGGIIASVTAITQGIRVTFNDGVFIGDYDYAATCNVTPLEGSDTGYAMIVAQNNEYVEFVFRDDDGSGGNAARFNVTIGYDLVL